LTTLLTTPRAAGGAWNVSIVAEVVSYAGTKLTATGSGGREPTTCSLLPRVGAAAWAPAEPSGYSQPRRLNTM
jgi:hypothetical protein